MKILAVDHIQLAIFAGGEDLADAFYADILGLERVEKPVPMRASGGVWFRGVATEIHLGVEDDFQPARKAHPALRVDDLDGFSDRLRTAGFDVLWDDRYPGVRRFYTHDPFGNRIELLADE